MTQHTLTIGPLSLLAEQHGPLLSIAIHAPSDSAPVGRMTLTVAEWTSLVALVDCMVAAEKRHAEDKAEIERLTALTMNPGATLHPSKYAADVERESYREGFRRLWCEINGAESWEANPFVWVIEFRRVEAQERAA